MGFELLHQPKTGKFELYVLGVGDGTRINLLHSDDPDFYNGEDGFIGMRVNVDDFDEGIAYFEGQGYEKVTHVSETESFKAILLTKSGRDNVSVFYHKK